jgi:Membrane-bound serine protease (ClpP class)
MDIAIVIALGLVGILLVLVEVFLIPGVSIAALAGIASLVGGVWYAFVHLGTTGGAISLIASLLVLACLVYYLVKSKTLNVIGLKTNIDSTVANEDSLKVQVGDTGITISRLNPIGKVRINDIVMEGKSLGELIEEDVEVEVLKVSPMQLIVKPK